MIDHPFVSFHVLKQVVFTLDGEEKDRISSPTGAWDGQTFGEGSGAGGGSANASGGTFGTFGPLDGKYVWQGTSRSCHW